MIFFFLFIRRYKSNNGLYSFLEKNTLNFCWCVHVEDVRGGELGTKKVIQDMDFCNASTKRNVALAYVYCKYIACKLFFFK